MPVRRGFWIALGLAIVIAIVALLSGCVAYSDGERAGYVIKFSNKGFVCKTWEGTMNLGGISRANDSDGNATLVATTFDFTITDKQPDLVKLFKDAVSNGKRVKVTYNQIAFPDPCTTDSGYFITAAEFTQ